MRLVNDCIDRMVLRTAVLAAQHDVPNDPVGCGEHGHLIRWAAAPAIGLSAGLHWREASSHTIGSRTTAAHGQDWHEHGEFE